MKLFLILFLLGINCISPCPGDRKKETVTKKQTMIPLEMMPGLLVQFN
ncbi:MAG: hypothetical protein ACJ749_01120 [Flavisolibacter sp.]